MKKKTAGLLSNIREELVTGFKLANMQRLIKDGTVDTWIKETTRNIVPYELKPDMEHIAYAEEDGSKIYIRLNEEDLKGLLDSPYSFKQAVQATIAHEMGHIVDPNMYERHQRTLQAIDTQDIDTLATLLLEREHTAWTLGKQFSTDLPYYNTYNQLNIDAYQALINQAKGVRA